MNRCPQCGSDNRTGARFCKVCGAALAAPPSRAPASSKPQASAVGGYTVKVCPRCQSPSRVGDRTCRTCGYAFATVAPPRRIWRWALLIGAGLALFGLAAAGRGLLWRGAPSAPTVEIVSSQTAPHPAALQQAIRATVEVRAPDPANPRRYAAGSGTVVDATRGFILTNFHVIDDPQVRRPEARQDIVIALSLAGTGQPPTPRFLARVAAIDRGLDLAVLRIIGQWNGGGLPADLGLTAIPLGDSDSVTMGDVVTVLGYPGLGGDTITLTRGTVSGFVDGWIKTDAEINHGNSGGAAIDAAGRLIGVPSAGRSEEVSADRLPGKIGLVRPIDQAKPLLEQAGAQW